jgi:putative aldouronate transport system substrate-binding protein
MKADILDKALAVGIQGPDDVGIPISVYEGYEDYIPDNALLYREYCSKMVLGTLPMDAWDEYVEKWYAQGGEEVLKRATAWYKKVNNIE